MIRQVKYLGAKLEAAPFVETEKLRHGKVPVDNPRARHGVATGIAKAECRLQPRRAVHKRCRVVVSLYILASRSDQSRTIVGLFMCAHSCLSGVLNQATHDAERELIGPSVQVSRGILRSGRLMEPKH